MWDERFASDEYHYGVEPSQFLRRQAHRLRPGWSALCVAEGEGRNAVFLAGLGLAVEAFDGSAVAVAKARRLAAERDVEAAFAQADAAAYDWTARTHDVVTGIFIQFARPAARDALFAGMVAATKPGGLILLHGYRTEQVALGTGGPRDPEQLYTEAMLRDAFGGCEILELESYEADLAEGRGHVGRSALIDLVARRP